MRTSRDLNEMAVIDVRDGKKLGSVDQVVISPENGRLLGFVMQRGGLFSNEEAVIEIEDVRAIGADAVTVEGDEVVHDTKAVSEEFREARKGDRSMLGRKVVTQGGSVAGQVSDVVINEEQRRVTALLIGGGLLEKGDALPAERIVSVGPDLIVIRDEDGDGQAPGPFSAGGDFPERQGHSPLSAASGRAEHGVTTEEPR